MTAEPVCSTSIPYDTSSAGSHVQSEESCEGSGVEWCPEHGEFHCRGCYRDIHGKDRPDE